MLLHFFYALRRATIPVSITEHLTLLEALNAGVIQPSIEEFYTLSRSLCVKDERYFDRFDRVFGALFQHTEALASALADPIPEDWLKLISQRTLSEEEKAAIEKMGGLEALHERLKQLMAEQKSRHAGGNKWIGTGGTSPFGHGGYHPEGFRIGGDSAGHRTAIKVWEARAFRDYDADVEMGTRTMKAALRQLRKFARTGAEWELDLDGTIRNTARNAGFLDLKMVPERHNAVKVLMLLDVGGSMDDHIARTEQLFSAAKSEFKHLEFYYFHNCLYDFVWRNNHRRHSERLDTWELLRKYNADWRVVVVGDATMSPYEIAQPGGSVEYNNAEAGGVWLKRLVDHFPRSVWLNPDSQDRWPYRQSIAMIQQIFNDRMYPITLHGLSDAIRDLSH